MKNFEENFAEKIVKISRERLSKNLPAKIATAESCTGGNVANFLTNVAGASEIFVGGIVAYSAQIKASKLGVPAEVFEKFGVVSEECARKMAAGAREFFGADFAVSTTGVAGPGASGGVPAGTVCVAVSSGAGMISETFFFENEPRERVKFLASNAALSLLFSELENSNCKQRAKIL